jgi:3-hydroxybutyryl-CoA dehydrogenase
VVGLGAMGSGIAEVFARGGWSVVGLEEQPAALDRARQRLATSTARAVERGKLDDAAAQALTARVSYTTDVADLAGCDVVVEAVPEAPPSSRPSSPGWRPSCAPTPCWPPTPRRCR